jgi:hypothetical protein
MPNQEIERQRRPLTLRHLTPHLENRPSADAIADAENLRNLLAGVAVKDSSRAWDRVAEIEDHTFPLIPR